MPLAQSRHVCGAWTAHAKGLAPQRTQHVCWWQRLDPLPNLMGGDRGQGGVQVDVEKCMQHVPHSAQLAFKCTCQGLWPSVDVLVP